mmetsp:Transcript_32972/g.35540  ORF Transcript_32972/g.35540 Transcript_32972/m.35540 type:complete len:562 (-) Transcript_32972:75-1760(-)
MQMIFCTTNKNNRIKPSVVVSVFVLIASLMATSMILMTSSGYSRMIAASSSSSSLFSFFGRRTVVSAFTRSSIGSRRSGIQQQLLLCQRQRQERKYGGGEYGNYNQNHNHNSRLFSTNRAETEGTESELEAEFELRQVKSSDDQNNNEKKERKKRGDATTNPTANPKTRRGRARIRREEQARLGTSTSQIGELKFEDDFDFSLKPKQDTRFLANGDDKDDDDDRSINEIASNTLEEYNLEKEIKQDQDYATTLQTMQNAYLKLDPTLVAKATAVIEPYINEQRLARISSVLSQRTNHVKFLYENPSNPSNVWACLRTIDSFGIQQVDVIIDSGQYQGKLAIQQKRGMRTAMGSAQWLTLTNHPTTVAAVQQLRREGYHIYASDLNPKSIDIRDIEWDHPTTKHEDPDDDVPDHNDGHSNSSTTTTTTAKNQQQQPQPPPICIVMGNEDRGISEEMRDLVDATFTIPMYGFAESFNLSVATSIILAHLSSKSYTTKSTTSSTSASSNDNDSAVGPLRPGDLPEHEYNCLYLKGLLQSLPTKRLGMALFKQHNIVLPNAIKEI